MSLTEEGAKLLAAGEKVESIIIRDILSLGESHQEIVGRVRIDTSEGFGVHYLAKRLPAMVAAYPGLEVELVALPRTYSLAMREVDIAITMDRPDSGDIRLKKLTSYMLGVYGAPAYFEDRPRPLGIEDLPDHRWCGYILDLLFTSDLDLLTFGGQVIRPWYRTTSVSAQLEVLHARSAKRADETRRAVPAKNVVVGDLSNIAEMKSVAEQINKLGTFDAVIHNAGIGYREPSLVKTKDRLPQLFPINTLAPYILTALITRPKRLIYLCSGMQVEPSPEPQMSFSPAVGTVLRCLPSKEPSGPKKRAEQ